MQTYENIQRIQQNPNAEFVALHTVSDSLDAVCIVTDSLTRTQFFEDDEIVGWVIWRPSIEDDPKLYHIYRRHYNEDIGEVLNIKGFFQKEPITGESRKHELSNMQQELSMQVAHI